MRGGGGGLGERISSGGSWEKKRVAGYSFALTKAPIGSISGDGGHGWAFKQNKTKRKKKKKLGELLGFWGKERGVQIL